MTSFTEDYMGASEGHLDADEAFEVVERIAGEHGYDAKQYGDTFSISRMKGRKFVHEGNIGWDGVAQSLSVKKGGAAMRRIAEECTAEISN